MANCFAGMDGYVAAFDLTNGKLLWKTKPDDGTPVDAPYGHRPFSMHSGIVIADNKVFACNGEHSPNQPLWRGSKLWCLDAENGELIWSILGWWDTGQPVIADGYLVALNGYDNRLYCFGKGPTSITINTPQTTIPNNTNVIITGTITDQSPGQEGSPAIADESMSEWMEYLHMQKPKPTNIKGVEIKLQAVNSNGESTDIGTVTSDPLGNYALKWTPQTEGQYQIIATFEGSKSYGSAQAATYLFISPETTNTQTDTDTATLVGSDSVLVVGIAIVALIVAIIASAIALQKR